ncbi:MAG: PAS domain S-box protein [Nitrospirae bacterium]|nr:PAS domain S-box protein [Nitrospirota bacterium]
MPFSGLSIKNKLVVIILTVAFIATGLGFTFVIINDIRTFRVNMVDNAVVNARLIGEYAVTPLVFNDQEGAGEILKKMAALPDMMNGYIYDEDGNLFAFYNREGSMITPPELPEGSSEFAGEYLHTSSPIIYKLGSVIMSISYVLAVRLQKILSGPILDLTRMTRTISEEGDYSLRIERKGTDEISVLYDSFNEMLEQVNIREAALLKEKEKLRKYLDTSAVIVVILDIDQRVTLINKKGCEILEFAEDEILGRKWFDNFLPESARDETKKIFSKMVSGSIEPVEYFENSVLTGSGGERLIAWYNTVLKDDKNNVTGTLSSGVDVTEKRMAVDKIKASLREKELLLREIHHRVKNNMQVIVSLLSLQSDKNRDGQYSDIFNDTKNRIKTMSLVHEKLYMSKDMASIDFQDYIKDLSRSLLSVYESNARNVSLTIEADNVFLNIDTAIPCGLIINELLSNSLKHAFPGGRKGEINIFLGQTLVEDRTVYDLVISDNGVGIPEGIEMGKSESLGLQLITTLIEHQLRGTLDLDRTNGTRMHVRFREINYSKRI